jgi:hypothetical protein
MLAAFTALGYRKQMAKGSPRAISAAQFLTREKRVQFIAKAVGFVGNAEYRHVYSQTGGAQYGRGSTQRVDLLTVYAEAFERDADPGDFSLESMIAHERGHPILARHPRIAKRVAGVSPASEEILASLLGAMICNDDTDRLALLAKATAELLDRGQNAENASRQLQELRDLLGALL